MSIIKNSETFGIEIEFPNEIYNLVRNLFDEYKNAKEIWSLWHLKADNSITKRVEIDGKIELVGGELVSPILACDFQLEEFEKILEFMNDLELESGSKASAHLHYGAHKFGDNLENYKKLILFWMNYESEIYKMVNGLEYIKDDMEKYAQSLNIHLYDKVDDIINFEGSYSELIKKFLSKRELTLNFSNLIFSSTKKTIETRMLKSTLLIEDWKNILLFFSKLYMYVVNMDYRQIYYLRDRLKNKLSRVPNQEILLNVSNESVLSLCELIGYEKNNIFEYESTKKIH